MSQEFARMGLSIAPTLILEAENFVKALEIAGQPLASVAYYQFGRNIICDREILNAGAKISRDEMLSLILHETAHSTAELTKLTAVGRMIGGTALNPIRRLDIYDQKNTFNKHYFTEAGSRNYGSFLEEGFADLTRVKVRTRLGREVSADDANLAVDEFGVRYLGRNLESQVLSYQQDLPAIPIRFGSSVTFGQRGSVELSCYNSSIAGYGLELLDKMVPDLYETMIESRTDPSKQRDFIRMINSVQPGLYRELQLLGYATADFRQGVVRIIEACNANA